MGFNSGFKGLRLFRVAATTINKQSTAEVSDFHLYPFHRRSNAIY